MAEWGVHEWVSPDGSYDECRWCGVLRPYDGEEHKDDKCVMAPLRPSQSTVESSHSDG